MSYFTGESGSRSVLSFTIRDSPFSYINVSMWGKPETLTNVASSFAIGDVGWSYNFFPFSMYYFNQRTLTTFVGGVALLIGKCHTSHNFGQSSLISLTHI